MDLDMKRLAKAVNAARKRRGETWKELARYLRVDRKTLYNWMHGQGRPSWKLLRRVLNDLDISPHRIQPYASVKTKHMLAPMDFTTMAGEFRQLRLDGRNDLAVMYMLHTAQKVGLSVKARLDDAEPRMRPYVESFCEFHEKGHHKAMVRIIYPDSDISYSIKLQPSALNNELDYVFRRHIMGTLNTVSGGRLREVALNRVIAYLATEHKKPTTPKKMTAAEKAAQLEEEAREEEARKMEEYHGTCSRSQRG